MRPAVRAATRGMAAPLWALIALAACDGPVGDEPIPTYSPDWSGVVALTEDHCASCHAPDLGNAVTLPDELLADVLAGTGPHVVPFEPTASRLWRVLDGALLEGDYAVMPLGSGPLPAETVAHVEEWILAGAPVPEHCNGRDDDRDGTVDEDAIDAEATWFADLDGDGFGSGEPVLACAAPAGFVARDDDCDDGDAAAWPGAPETCDDTVDRNCDGAVGRIDGDGDGSFACEECDDRDAAVFPGAEERCNGVDDDCDGRVDVDAVDAEPWYADADGDGWGSGEPVISCDPGEGATTTPGDCDDSDATVHPGVLVDATNGTDDDCDGAVDEDGDAVSHGAEVQPIWDRACLRCHGPPKPSGDLDLTSGWTALVGVPSAQAPLALVEPFEPDRSYLWHKLKGTQITVGGSGSRMPKTGSLSTTELALIEAWIASGAAP